MVQPVQYPHLVGQNALGVPLGPDWGQTHGLESKRHLARANSWSIEIHTQQQVSDRAEIEVRGELPPEHSYPWQHQLEVDHGNRLLQRRQLQHEV